MHTSSTLTATQNPQRLIKRLCKHWSHKFEVTLEENSGEIQLPNGVCKLKAVEGGLAVALSVEDTEQLEQMETVVAEHLQRMASDETLGFDWQRNVD